MMYMSKMLSNSSTDPFKKWEGAQEVGRGGIREEVASWLSGGMLAEWMLLRRSHRIAEDTGSSL